MRLKKRFMACAILVLLVSLVGQTTLAYFSTSSTARNVITSGKIAVDLVEKKGGYKADMTKAELLALPKFEDVKGVVPGMEVSKIVFVQSGAGAADAWVRIKCDLAVEGFTAEQLKEAITLDYDTGNWTYKEGYWYYNSVVKAGEVTKPLFTSVTFKSGMGNEYQASDVVIDIYAEAVQVANNGATALSAQGWPNT